MLKGESNCAALPVPSTLPWLPAEPARVVTTQFVTPLTTVGVILRIV